jgi:hypothetical protein
LSLQSFSRVLRDRGVTRIPARKSRSINRPFDALNVALRPAPSDDPDCAGAAESSATSRMSIPSKRFIGNLPVLSNQMEHQQFLPFGCLDGWPRAFYFFLT